MKATKQKLRVLVIEDEGVVGMLIEDMLTDMGHEVAAVVAQMTQALHVAQTGCFDFAMVDINLEGRPSYPVAEILRARGIPFIFATGYGAKALDPKFAAIPTLAKPFLRTELEAAVLNAIKR